MRARQPDVVGDVDRDGVRIHYEVHGSGPVTVLLLPTWAIVHSRFWKLQVPYLARHVRVVVADPRGNGRSGRPVDPAAYADEELVADTLAVLDATGTRSAVCVGLSLGGRILLELAAGHPERVDGAVFVGPSMNVVERRPPGWSSSFEAPYGFEESGWRRYNAEFWRQDLPGFARWFFGQCFPEAHSSKQVDDAVGWALETDADTLVATERAPRIDAVPAAAGPTEASRLTEQVRCPTLVVHGQDDRIIPVQVGRELAAALGGQYDEIVGGGHCVNARHPVWFNHRLLRFVEEVTAGARA
jgi:pimeloyl-ACP methyl ester carboxylesterase